jgi:hypothetical protein
MVPHPVRPVRNVVSVARTLTILAAISVSPLLGCHTPGPVAPTYEAQKGAAIDDAEFPLAAAHYALSKPGSSQRADVARPLADRLMLRAGSLFAGGRERTGLAAMRLAAVLVRVNRVAPEGLADLAANVFDAAVAGPAARGEEGVALGLYTFWSIARPKDPRPKMHMDALADWTGAPKDFPPSRLVSLGREATRRSDALAYAPTAAERPTVDETLMRWMDQIVAFKDGDRVAARYSDEVYAAVLGFRTSGLRLVAGHLRDGDFAGANEAIAAPQTQGFIPEGLRRALLEAGASPTENGYTQLIGALLPSMKVETAEESVADAILGTSLAGSGDYPRSPTLAEITARGFLLAGAGDAAPAILARALLGTKDDPRRAGAKDLSRALAITSAALRDYADREDFDSARRTFSASSPLLLAADQVGGVSPSSAMVKTLMAVVEGEGGRPLVARTLYDQAIESEAIPTALAGRARLEAREGHVAAARALCEKGLQSPGVTTEGALHAEVLALCGDLARRGGDFPGARTHYEKALRALVLLRSAAKGPTAAELGRRIALILARFADAADAEDAAETMAESAASVDTRALYRIALVRWFRALRGPNPKRARSAFERAVDLGLTQEELVRAAILERAVAKQAAVNPDPGVVKVLNAAAGHDDQAGRMARFALGTLDATTLIAKSVGPRRTVLAKFVVAIAHWGEGGVATAKAELAELARADLIGALESELVLELIEPEKATIPGGVTATAVPGL